MTEDIRSKAVLWEKGRRFEDFEVGQVFEHHWGRTISEHDALLFSTLTLAFNPLYLNRDYAKALGHPDIVVNPQLVFNVTLGLSVEDCSEKIGGPFMGVYDLAYEKPVYPGATLTARSTTLEKRLSESRPGRGVVTWRTEGFVAGERVIVFRRTNLARVGSRNEARRPEL